MKPGKSGPYYGRPAAYRAKQNRRAPNRPRRFLYAKPASNRICANPVLPAHRPYCHLGAAAPLPCLTGPCRLQSYQAAPPADWQSDGFASLPRRHRHTGWNLADLSAGWGPFSAPPKSKPDPPASAPRPAFQSWCQRPVYSPAHHSWQIRRPPSGRP